MTDEEVTKTLETAEFYDKALDKLPEWWRKHPDNINGFALAKGHCEKAKYLISRNMRNGRAAEYVAEVKDYYQTAHDRISDWVTDMLD
jgi:hypothetical protein